MNPYNVVNDFEKTMAEYVGSKYAVSVDSCTNALFLCCHYLNVKEVTIPSKTYVSVPCSIIHAGGTVKFEKFDWEGHYQLKPYPIFDYACEMARGMYVPNTYQCVSFSANKILNIGKGGMIFTDNKESVNWFKKARYEGRDETSIMKQKIFDFVGWNMYMTPEQASRGIVLSSYLEENKIIKPQYPELADKFLPKGRKNEN